MTRLKTVAGLGFLLVSMSLVGCGSSESKDANATVKSGEAAPVAAQSANGAGGTGAPTAMQGGHFANPNATVTQPGSKLSGN